MFTLSRPARASEPELFGLGARAGAMAGLGAADAEGYDAAYANPAGLIGPTRRRLTLGYVGGIYHLRLDGARRQVDNTSGVIIGADLPIPFGGILRDRVALGLAFYFPTGLINRASDGFPDDTRLALLDDRTQVVSALVGVGVRVHRRVSVGVGVLALAALIGEISIRPDAGGRITTIAEEQLVASFTPIVGIRAVATDRLNLGLVFRGESRSRYDIDIKNSLGTLLPIQIPTLRIAGTSQYDPLQLQLEASLRANHWLRLDLGATWKHFSTYTNPVENATAGAPDQPSPDYHDTIVPRAGGEAVGHWGRVALTARLGYFFEWSPAPQGPDRVLLDADRHVITGGGGLEYHGRLISIELDAFAQWHHLAGNPRATGDFAVFGGTFGIDL
jgi:long-chain fatty acid transport protein